MKKITISLFLIVPIFSHIKSYSQVTLTIQNLQYAKNGQTINASNCGLIDLGTSSSSNINFVVNLSKSNELAVGTGTVKIFTKKSDSDFEQENTSQAIP